MNTHLINSIGALIAAFVLMGFTPGTNGTSDLSSDQNRDQNRDQDQAPAPASFTPPLTLMFHDIVTADLPDEARATSDTTLEEFKMELDYLAAHGYQTISAQDVLAAKRGQKILDPKSVLLTFDDGYVGNFDFAYPLLSARGMKATFFVHTNWIGEHLRPKKHMTFPQLRELARNANFEVYAHTESHLDLTSIESSTQLQKEICHSRDVMELELGGDRNIFAYPYGKFARKNNGSYDLSVLKMTQSCFDLAFAIDLPPDLDEQTKNSGLVMPRLAMVTTITDADIFERRIKRFQSAYQSH